MKKLKNDSGSALILALFLMTLVSIIIVSFSNQVSNQIRSTINLDEDIQERYYAESNIEKFIKYFIEGTNIVYKGDDTCEYEMSYKNLAYINENEEEVSESKSEKVIMEMTAEPIESENYASQDNSIKISSNTEKITFMLDIKEGKKFDIKSCIKVNIMKINGDSGNETYEVDYGVEYWRIRN